MNHIETILDFWFGELDENQFAPKDKSKRWYKKDPKFDALLREQFGDLVEQAKEDALDDWQETPEGSIALIILLDQFTRNIYRDTPEAFSGDTKAQSVSLTAVEKGFDKKLPISMQQFMYMPLMHAEDRDLQQKSLDLFTALQKEVPDKHKDRVSVGYAQSHKDIVDRFGKFPHRDKTLGRESTDEEIEFLKGPNSSFLISSFKSFEPFSLK